MPSFGFIGPFGLSQNPTVDPEDLVNLYPELTDSGGIPTARGSKYSYFSRPGIQKIANLGSTGRALWGGNNALYALVDSHVLQLNNLGGVIASFAVGNAAANQPGQIVFVPSGPGLSGPTSGALLVWDGSPPGFGSAANLNVWYLDGVRSIPVISGAGVGSIDGYGVVLRPAGNYPSDPVPINTTDGTQFNISNLYDASTWDSLNFGIKTTSPDQLINIYTPGSSNGPNRDEMWLQGKRTTEVWYDTGGTTLDPFPFARVPGAFIPIGVLSQNAAVALSGNLIWLGQDQNGVGVVWKSNGYTPARISTHAIENIIRQSGNNTDNLTGDAVMFSYEENGHSFVCLTFSTTNNVGGATLVWDDTEGLWHRRAFNGTTVNSLGLYHAWEFGAHYLLDSAGNLYTQSLAHYQDIGAGGTVPITFSRTTPVITAENRLLNHNQLELIFGAPYNNLAYARTFYLAISNDGGATFGSPVTVTTGPSGSTNSKDRCIFRRLGSGRKRCYQLYTTDNLPQAWLDAIAEWSDSTEKVGTAQ